jgi:hypothetical protein
MFCNPGSPKVPGVVMRLYQSEGGNILIDHGTYYLYSEVNHMGLLDAGRLTIDITENEG